MEGPPGIRIARGNQSWIGNQLADWIVVRHLVTMRRLFPLEKADHSVASAARCEGPHGEHLAGSQAVARPCRRRWSSPIVRGERAFELQRLRQPHPQRRLLWPGATGGTRNRTSAQETKMAELSADARVLMERMAATDQCRRCRPAGSLSRSKEPSETFPAHKEICDETCCANTSCFPAGNPWRPAGDSTGRRPESGTRCRCGRE